MKKEKDKENFPWKKVLVIAVGVLFVFMMVLSAMGMSWLQSFRTVRANDSVTLDFTLLDSRGQPVLTTDQNIYRTGIMNGGMPFLTSPLTVRAGYVGNPAYTGLDAVNYYLSSQGSQLKFGILGQELDELDVAVLGMKTGEKKTIPFSFSVPPVIFMDYELTAMGGNFTSVRVGDLIPLGFSTAPMVSGLEGFESDPENEAMRIGTVFNKTGASIGVDHQYPMASITVQSIG
jgi:hypothetical protein